jgi:hypothetical protein
MELVSVWEELGRISTVLTDCCGFSEPMQTNVAIMPGHWLPPPPSKSLLTYLSTPSSRFIRHCVTLTDEKENSCVG